MRRGEKTPDELSRPDGNGLKANYEKHDVGHAEIVARLNALGLRVEDWGIDMRDDDGSDGIVYDDKMDFKVFDGDELVAIIDVKTKGSPKYMGRFNERHYVHYHEHAEEFDVPVFVAMFQVDYRENEVHDEMVFKVGDGELYERVETSDSQAVPRFPDGNGAVLVPHEHRRSWDYLERCIEYKKMENMYRETTENCGFLAADPEDAPQTDSQQ